MARILRLGRLIALLPLELGNQFRDACTVTLVKQERPCFQNGWQKKAVYDENKLWWEDVDPVTNQPAFCTLAGYEHKIVTQLKSLGIPVEIEQRVDSGLGKPEFARIGNVQLRQHQKEMLVKLCSNVGGLFVAATGAGKSTLIRLIARIYPDAKIVITVPSVDVADDLYKALTAAPELSHEVGFIGGGHRAKKRITVAVTHSAEKCDQDTNLVLCDEAHMMLTKRFIKILNHFHRAKFFGFTASPDGKSDGSDGFMEALFGPILAESDYQASVDVGSVVPIVVRQLVSSVGPDLSNVSRDDVKEALGIIQNKARNQLVADETRKVMNELGPDSQVLIMVSKVEHAYRLQQLLPEFTVVTAKVSSDRFQELEKMGAFNPATQRACSTQEREQYKKAFADGTLKYAIANSVWERGVDFKDLACLVRADGAASTIKACQIPGRLSRTGSDGQKERGLLIDLYDNFDKGLKRKSQTRFAAYRSHGWDVQRASP